MNEIDSNRCRNFRASIKVLIFCTHKHRTKWRDWPKPTQGFTGLPEFQNPKRKWTQQRFCCIIGENSTEIQTLQIAKELKITFKSWSQNQKWTDNEDKFNSFMIYPLRKHKRTSTVKTTNAAENIRALKVKRHKSFQLTTDGNKSI